MKSEEIYNAWKEHKSQIGIRKNFADELMNLIYQYEQKKRKPCRPEETRPLPSNLRRKSEICGVQHYKLLKERYETLALLARM